MGLGEEMLLAETNKLITTALRKNRKRCPRRRRSLRFAGRLPAPPEFPSDSPGEFPTEEPGYFAGAAVFRPAENGRHAATST